MTETLLLMICSKYHTAGLSFGERGSIHVIGWKGVSKKKAPLGLATSPGGGDSHLPGVILKV